MSEDPGQLRLPMLNVTRKNIQFPISPTEFKAENGIEPPLSSLVRFRVSERPKPERIPGRMYGNSFIFALSWGRKN